MAFLVLLIKPWEHVTFLSVALVSKENNTKEQLPPALLQDLSTKIIWISACMFPVIISKVLRLVLFQLSKDLPLHLAI
jgi:hypothetical protein